MLGWRLLSLSVTVASVTIFLAAQIYRSVRPYVRIYFTHGCWELGGAFRLRKD